MYFTIKNPFFAPANTLTPFFTTFDKTVFLL